jgi:hypothetical protein
MATIKTLPAGVSPYPVAAPAPTVLVTTANGRTSTVVAASAVGTGTTVIVNGQAALNGLITTNQSGVFDGANITINLEEQNFNTTNQVTATTNYPSGNTGEIQYNSGANSFASDAYFTYTNSNVVTPGIRTNGYFYGNGAPFTAGGNAAIGNFVFSGDVMTISDANQVMSITGNGTGNIRVTSNGNIWTFDNVGNLTLPSNSSSINYANGSPYGGNYSNSNVASFLAAFGSNSVSTSGTITAVTISAVANVIANNAQITNIVTSANLQVVGTANVGALSTVGSVSANGNVTTLSTFYGGNGATWQNQVNLINVLFVAADVANDYVQAAMIETGGNGSADWVSYANNGNSSAGYIDMGVTGNTFNDPGYGLTLPNDGYIIVQGTNVSGTPLGGNLILATGNTGSARDIVFATGGFEQANIKARLYNSTGEFSVVGNIAANNLVTNSIASDDSTFVTIRDGLSVDTGLISAPGNLDISAGIHTWTFEAGGNLIFPTGMAIDDEGANTRIYQTSGSLKIRAQTTASLKIGWDEFTGANANGSLAHVIANGGGSGEPANLVVLTGNSSSTTYQWIFGNNGILTLPGNSRVAPVGANIELQAAAGGYAEIVTSDGNNYVAVTTSGAQIVTSGAYIWAFNNAGNLTLPGNTFAVNYANGNPVVISAGGLPLANGTSNINIATANGNVTITANATTWTFGSNSKITLPNGALLNDTSGDSVAFGQNAGLTSQAQHAVAIGINAGRLYQGEDSVAIGYNAGYYDQQRGVAIGWDAGEGGILTKSVSDAQGGSGPVHNYVSGNGNPTLTLDSVTNVTANDRVFGNNIPAGAYVVSIADPDINISAPPTAALTAGDAITFVGVVIGLNNATNVVVGMRATGTDIPANTFVQSTGCSVVTLNQYPTAPLTDGASIVFTVGQGFGATAIGYQAGSSFQDDNAVAVGRQAGYSNQGANAVAVGAYAGYTQSANAVAVGTYAGFSTQNINAVAVGYKAGQNSQGARAVAIGEDAGYNTQGEDAVAVGQKAGFASQGRFAVAIGNTAGYSGQSEQAVSIGYGTGLVSQGNAAVAIGANAASYAQGNLAVAIGQLAGNTSQGANSVAIGANAAANVQGNNAVAVGWYAGYDTQGADAVALGQGAGYQGQGIQAVAIGPSAAAVNQGAYAISIGAASGSGQGNAAVAIGVSAGYSSQGANTVAIGRTAGAFSQGNSAVAVGYFAGNSTQGQYAVAVGDSAGLTSQGNLAVAIGYQAGLTTQGTNSVAVGALAGNANQGTQAVAIGLYAGTTTQGQYSVAVGGSAGSISQGQESVAVGVNSGSTAQGIGAVSIGASAGASSQGNTSVAVGTSSGALSQGANAVAIGLSAGYTGQGTAAVAIGTGAGYTNQGNNSIILNATAANLNQTTANTFTVAPVRNDVANIGNVMFYNTTSKEITYGNVISVAGNIAGGNLSITGNITGNTGGFAIGYLNIPQVSLAANVTTALTDSGKHYYSTSASNLALTIANNTSVSWAVGTAISLVNRGTGNITVAQDSGVSLYLAGNATAGNRTVTTYGMATLLNVAANIWMINGTGVS